MATFQTILADEMATEAFGSRLAALLDGGTVIALYGDLGAGKTTLVRGVLRALGHQGAVRSPTYALVESYQTERFPLYHFDLYRLGDPEELEYMGIRDYLDGRSVAFIEWPQRGEGILPAADLRLTLRYRGELPGREVNLESGSDNGSRLISRLDSDC